MIRIYFIEHDSLFSPSEVTGAYISILVAYVHSHVNCALNFRTKILKTNIISGGCAYTVRHYRTFCSLESSDNHIDFGINKQYVIRFRNNNFLVNI